MAKLIENVKLALPDLPQAAEDLRIAHLTDLHVARATRTRYRHLRDAVKKLEADLFLFTGDYMCDPGDETAAMEVMHSICDHLNPRLDTFGVFGNHDSYDLRERAESLPVHWLTNQAVTLPDVSVELLGFENDRYTHPDAVALLVSMSNQQSESSTSQADKHNSTPAHPLRILLSHYPTMLPTASDLGVDLMFSGHTHGGQWRLPGRRALYTSCDLPSDMAAGVLRHRKTLGIVSRGLGETWIPIRFFCPPQLPVITLSTGEMRGDATDHLSNTLPW
jgi:uncharacterized protein